MRLLYNISLHDFDQLCNKCLPDLFYNYEYGHFKLKTTLVYQIADAIKLSEYNLETFNRYERKSGSYIAKLSF